MSRASVWQEVQRVGVDYRLTCERQLVAVLLLGQRRVAVMVDPSGASANSPRTGHAERQHHGGVPPDGTCVAERQRKSSFLSIAAGPAWSTTE
eukprot:CAMPEP_0115873690 /NCGR_PEP_ID=MMETSP0287-20121206/24129_1 /TAXON_ID=412157 /ORGANISM="Chrysochromulina rotalis, Strain UIO044" /LENGTH=92 /DNA_ID=CAMNT_0003328765 /DNA_START=114 /DNA_END=393 /DNA_ORIENTATION=-